MSEFGSLGVREGEVCFGFEFLFDLDENMRVRDRVASFRPSVGLADR